MTGITGNVSIDSNGDRNADYSLLDLNPKSGKFEVSGITSKRTVMTVISKSQFWR